MKASNVHAYCGKSVKTYRRTFIETQKELTVIENERRKAKNAVDDVGEQSQRQAEVFVWIEAQIYDGDTLAVRFTYKRSVAEEGFNSADQFDEEEGREHKFEISSGIVLHAGQGCIAGANLNEGLVQLLIAKADLK